jgi:uncharacterized membrane protein
VPRSISVLAALTAFAILVGFAILGIVETWPQHHKVPRPPGSLRPETHDAEVVAVALGCHAPGPRSCKRVTVELRGGPEKGKRVSFDFPEGASRVRIAPGDAVRVYKTPLPPGVKLPPNVDRYAFSDFQRRSPLIWLTLAFATIVVLAGRAQGIRSLLGLTISLGTLVLYIVPAILDGQPALQVALYGALAIMLATIPLAHGANLKAVAACLGTAVSLILTLVLADVFTSAAHLSGVSSDEAIYLQSTSGVSLRGLLLAGMVIGALGVLADTTVTQASTVIALRAASPTLGFRALVRHATSVGRDHIAATVNTLVLAYAGAALPILLIFNVAGTSFSDAVNGEAVAEQIVATLVGSIGLIAAVPITTALAAVLALGLGGRQLQAEAEHAHAHVH